MKWYTVVTLGIVLIVYTVIGGVIFSHLESRYEDDLRDQVLSDLKTFIDESPCVNMTALGHAYALLQDMKEAGLEIQSDGSMVRKTLWDIRSSLFVSLQLLATIGFPEAAPRSAGGRGFTIPYAILGIPLFLVAAIGMGQVFNGVAEAFRKCLTRACRREPDCGAKVFRTIIISVTGIIFFIIIPSLIFKQIEPWSYGDAFYFSFITLATIGFGDLVPSYNDVRWMSDNYRNWYRLAIAFWILLLSAWFAGVLVSIQTSVTAAAFSSKNRLHIKSLEEDVLDDYVSTNMNLAMPKDMKVKHPPKHSTYNHYIHQQQWQQEQQQAAVAASPYNIYNSQQNGQQPQATYGTGNSVAYGEITRLSV